MYNYSSSHVHVIKHSLIMRCVWVIKALFLRLMSGQESAKEKAERDESFSVKRKKRALITQTQPAVTRLFLTCFLLLLAGCSHVVRQDGPPNFYVDETKIPNATPKPEPLAKYGNMSSYRVFGKRYYTMKSSKNYQAVGTASWYGTLFHARRTSSGERYNMLGMTAAHKTLPLPTYVEVTNLKNNRKVIVKVNDRGPFLSNRLIDLSYVAAKKLGMLGRGTTTVKIKAIDPNPVHRKFFKSPAPSWVAMRDTKRRHAPTKSLKLKPRQTLVENTR